MEINYFKEFVVLSKTLNFHKAADQLFISQPTLTQHIKKMEEELGTKLIERSTRRVALTECGKALLPYAIRITDIQDEYTEDLNGRQNSTRRKQINVGAAMHIPDALMEFAKLHPGIQINTTSASTDLLKGSLRRHQCDIILVRESEDNLDNSFERTCFQRDELLLVMPAGHALAGEAVVPVERLKKEKFVAWDENSQAYRASVALCRNAGFFPKVAHRVQRTTDLLTMVKSGLGIALITRSSIDSLAALGQNGIAWARTTPCTALYINALYLSRTSLSPNAQLLLDYLSDCYSTMQKEEFDVPGGEALG